MGFPNEKQECQPLDNDVRYARAHTHTHTYTQTHTYTHTQTHTYTHTHTHTHTHTDITDCKEARDESKLHSQRN
jgi:hypothetical protein